MTLARSQVREQEARLADAVVIDDRNAARALLAAYRDRVGVYDRALRALERQRALSAGRRSSTTAATCVR